MIRGLVVGGCREDSRKGWGKVRSCREGRCEETGDHRQAGEDRENKELVEVSETQEEKVTETKQLVSPRARGCSPASRTVRDVQAVLSQVAGKTSSKMGALIMSTWCPGFSWSPAPSFCPKTETVLPKPDMTNLCFTTSRGISTHCRSHLPEEEV